MEWVDGLNRTIRYMEEHLTEEIRCGELAKIACCSAYHYQRMVDLLAGEKVVDVALKYGYQSPTAFNRAFQAFHGIAPSAARDAGAPVKSFSPLHFTITVKGAEEMEYRVEKRACPIPWIGNWRKILRPCPGCGGRRRQTAPSSVWRS